MVIGASQEVGKEPPDVPIRMSILSRLSTSKNLWTRVDGLEFDCVARERMDRDPERLGLTAANGVAILWDLEDYAAGSKYDADDAENNSGCGVSGFAGDIYG